MHPNLFCSSAMYIMLHDWFLVVLMHAWFQLVSTLKIMYCVGCGSSSNIPGILHVLSVIASPYTSATKLPRNASGRNDRPEAILLV